jgi:cytochrome c oxidase subunit 2
MWNQIFPEQASTIAAEVDQLFYVETLLSLLFAVPIAAAVIFFAIKYRIGAHTKHYNEVTEGRGHQRIWILETTWIVIPLILALGVYWWGARLYFDIYALPREGMDVYVVGKQWMWKFQQPTGQTEIDELHVPVGYPVRLTMISEDVIHSFYVPAFRVKRDVVPGQYTTAWFEATQVGEYPIRCAEYCGTEHSRMLGTVIVMEPNHYQQWISQRSIGSGTGNIPEERVGAVTQGSEMDTASMDTTSIDTASMAAAGEELFTTLGCNSCHREDGVGAGPSLVGLWGREEALEDGTSVVADMDYIRQSILDPSAHIVAGYPPIMPTYEGQVDEEELLALIEYIRSLGE